VGGDGGSVPHRTEQVKLKQKVTCTADPSAVNSELATTCALGHVALAKPIVVCDLGVLYNRDSVATFLMEKKNVSYAFSHIRSMKDVYPANPHFLDETKSVDESTRTPIICPVTQHIFDRHRPFVFLRGCQCIVSENAMKKMGAGKCPACEAPIPDAGEDEFEHFVPLLPNMEVKDKLRERLLAIRQRERADKNAKKAAKLASSSSSARVDPVSSSSSETTSSLSLSTTTTSSSSTTTTATTTSTTTPTTTASTSKSSKKSSTPSAPLPASSFLDGVKFTGLSKEEQREEKKKKRKLEAASETKAKVVVKDDERAAEDPRFKSKAFASIFMPRGMDDSRNRKEYMSGISTKALSQMSYL